MELRFNFNLTSPQVSLHKRKETKQGEFQTNQTNKEERPIPLSCAEGQRRGQTVLTIKQKTST